MPSAADLTLAREYAAEQEEEKRRYQRKKEKAEGRDRIEDMVGPKAVGREAMLEKKQVRREMDRTFRERGDDGFDLDESTTMGGGDSFQQRYSFTARMQYKTPNQYFLGLLREMLLDDDTSTRRKRRHWQ
jgi:hypothetical protein